MSPLSQNLLFFFTAISILISFSISPSSATEFIFNTNFSSTNILLLGNATIQSSVLTLTNDVRFSIGRALYRSKIPIGFSDSSSVSPSFSFATSFIFSMAPVRNSLPGHGFAFLFTPFSGINGTSSAQHLGLFNFTNNGSPNNHVFAIEFDSFQNQEFNDPNDNHVGLDVNSLQSIASFPAGLLLGEDDEDFRPLKLNNGSNYQVWIDCRNSLVNVTMALAGGKKPRRPLISQFVNFSEVLVDEMFVGFTASTGQLVQSHRILSWSFSTTNSSIGDALVFANLPSFVLSSESINRPNALFIALVTVAGGFVVAGGVLVYLLHFRRKKRQKKEEVEDWELEYWPHRFAYEDVYEATDGFSEANVIGLGGNGKVYKGVLKGAEVAVKRISLEVESKMREFLAEVSSLGRLKHRNLVRLLGWCKKERRSLILIYDFMGNGSLDKKLFECGDDVMLDWEQRMKVLKDVANGLAYLHQGWEFKVLHRDIKASNVLLDKNMNAKLGDFGLARMHHPDQSGSTTQVVGTVGYMAPEVVRTGRVSVQADVFGFGVLVLEVVCGRRSIEEGKSGLIDWVGSLMEKDELACGLDERLKAKSDRHGIHEVEMMLCLGLLCAHPDPTVRPTMEEVLKILDEMNEEGSNDRLFKVLRTKMISTHVHQTSHSQQHPTFSEVKALIFSRSPVESYD